MPKRVRTHIQNTQITQQHKYTTFTKSKRSPSFLLQIERQQIFLQDRLHPRRENDLGGSGSVTDNKYFLVKIF